MLYTTALRQLGRSLASSVSVFAVQTAEHRVQSTHSHIATFYALQHALRSSLLAVPATLCITAVAVQEGAVATTKVATVSTKKHSKRKGGGHTEQAVGATSKDTRRRAPYSSRERSLRYKVLVLALRVV